MPERCTGPRRAARWWPGAGLAHGISRPHGARGGGPKGARNGAYRDGLHTAEAVAERRAVAALLR